VGGGVAASAKEEEGRTMQVSNVLDNIDLGAVALPEFQRGYVWNREQVRSFRY
jgi:uncharacterized protein with ParB-like and HNH nuclease domain